MTQARTFCELYALGSPNNGCFFSIDVVVHPPPYPRGPGWIYFALRGLPPWSLTNKLGTVGHRLWGKNKNDNLLGTNSEETPWNVFFKFWTPAYFELLLAFAVSFYGIFLENTSNAEDWLHPYPILQELGYLSYHAGGRPGRCGWHTTEVTCWKKNWRGLSNHGADEIPMVSKKKMKHKSA